MLRLDGSQRSATTSGTYRLSSGAPFRLHSIFNTGDSTDTPDIAIVSSSFRGPFEAQPEFATASARVGQKSIRFDVWAVKLDLSVRGTDIKTLDVAWHRRGDSAPVYISRHTASGSFLIVGGSVYEEADTSLPKPYEPTPEEIAPIPRLDENLDAKSAAAADPPPYSWIQTADGLTVAFPLPSSTPKTQIKVLFTPSTLTLHINTSIKTSVPIPRYSAKKLWDFISPSTSYWTWDREAEHEFGLLTLHLDKQHEGTRWMQVFAVAATTTGVSADAEDLEVPETVDPSELYKVRESLEKYTEALREGKDASGLGLGTGVPSLAEGEMDEEVDSSIGKTAYVTWVQSDGLTPAWSQATATIPVQILSTPLPGAARPKSSSPTVQHGISLVTKSNVDGLVFLLEQDPSTTGGEASSSMLPLIWTHTSTYPALAFVLASKQDTRFTHHTPYGVLAFDNGSSQNRGGNVYIYWKQKHVSDAVGKTGVLTITNGYQGGSLLGVGSVYVGGKEDETMEAVRSAPSAHEKKEMLVVCLTEKQLVVIREASAVNESLVDALKRS